MCYRLFLIFILYTISMAKEPLTTAIQHPNRLRFYSIYPQSATIDKKLFTSVTLYETNDYEKEDGLYLDMEITTLQTAIFYTPTDTLQIRTIIPLYHIYGGFMDSFLDWFHDRTGLLNGKRHDINGKNRLFYKIDHLFDRQSPYSVLGNIQIEAKRVLPFHFCNTTQALTFGIKLPTSPTSKGFGSGKVDCMAGWLIQKNWDEDTLWINCNITKNGSYHLGSLAASKNMGYFFYLGWEHHFRTNRSFLVAYRYASSPFASSTPILHSVSNVVDIAWRMGNFDIFLSENLAPYFNAPDITIGAAFHF